MRQVENIRTNWKNNTWENASKREAIYHDNASAVNQRFESDELSVKLFPNPTDLSITVEFKDRQYGVAYADKKTLEIYSINGQKVFEKEFTGFHTSVITSQIPPGTYIFKVYTSKLNIPIKVVIN
ncbi:MAG: T9SS type A sorting domain-containing protein [candidate division Zixibacteria bacterium]|nr:T9SS type A sorting domain-containing protein [candidate division Zixibacteria bacterium]